MALGVAIVLSLVAVSLVDSSAHWILAIWFGVALWVTVRGSASAHRALWFNGAVFIAILGVGTLTFLRSDEIQHDATPRTISEPHPDLGYRPSPGQTQRMRKYTDTETLYDVVYTVGENGLRMPPPHIEDPEKPCVLFFGGSHVYGEGVMDDEALPYRFGLETGGRFQVHNFGFSGYGAHQMLAAMERGLVESAIDCNPHHVVYQGAYFHIPRAGGLSSWDQEGPWYEPVGPDTVEYLGQLKEFEGSVSSDSGLIQTLGIDELISGLHRPANGHDYDRYIGILENARRHVEEKYPDAEFHVLLMDDKRNGPLPFYVFAWNRPPLPDDLQQRGFHVLRRSDALPDLLNSPELYEIPMDRHPNAKAQAMIARYLARELTGSSALQADSAEN